MKTGKIYKIISSIGDEVYIGSSCNTTRDRYRQHKINYKMYKEGKHHYVSVYQMFDKYGVNNCKMILVKEYKVVDKLQLRAYEQLWINRSNCINKQCAFQLLKKERNRLYRKNNREKMKQKKKDYYQNNKELIKQKQSDYYENNKDKIQEYRKSYYQNNKEFIKQKQSDYYEANKELIKQKDRLYYQNNKEFIKQKQSDYYEANKELIKQKDRLYYQNNKDLIKQKQSKKIKCKTCNIEIRKDSLSKHNKTRKHLNNLQ